MEIIEDEQLYDEYECMSEEAKYLLDSIDSFETDAIIFSEIVKLLTTHPAKSDGAGSDIGMEQISVLEKFVTKEIEQEESQRRIMIKLQERVIEESKHEDHPENFPVDEMAHEQLLGGKSSLSNSNKFINFRPQIY
jgi:hypothetical protein